MTSETEASRLSDHLQHDHEPVVLSTDTAYRAVSWIETYTGRPFSPLKPRVEDVSVIDIAHHLSNQCRYSGAPVFFYSTAQHCCLLADYVKKVRKGSPLDCLQILMHDSAETYLIDMPRPIKQFLPDFRIWDHALTMTIRSWLGLDGVPIPAWQDELDSRIIIDERAQIKMDAFGLDWGMGNVEPLGIDIVPWSAPFAEQQFLMRYAQYSEQVFGSHQYLRSGWGVPTNAIYLPDFKTAGSDTAQHGTVEPRTVTDLIEVDIRGGVGRVALRSPDGMMIRDTSAGRFPRPAWEFIHGKFELLNLGEDNGLG